MRLLFLSSLAAAAAADLTLTLHLPPSPNPFALPPSTHATLSTLGSLLSAPLSSSNSFVFHNVTPGSYLADVHCPTEAYHPLRIDVTDPDSTSNSNSNSNSNPDSNGNGNVRKKSGIRAWETFRGNEWGNKGEEMPVKVGGGVEVRHLGSKTFFVERPAFSILSILKSPMILMGLGTMGLVFGLPYLMDNMDPELRAEFEEHQRSSPMNAIMGNAQAGQPMGNFDMAAYLAGSNKKDGGSGGGGGSGSGSGSGNAAPNTQQQGIRR